MEKIFNDVNWFSEICCDDCGDIIHNHFDCPICNFKLAGTSIYCAVYDLEKDDKEFECEECGTKFIYLDSNDYHSCNIKLKEIK